MDALDLKGRWSELKGKALQQYVNLTEDDVAYEEGQDEQLLGRLQQKLGKSREELIRWLNSLG